MRSILVLFLVCVSVLCVDQGFTQGSKKQSTVGLGAYTCRQMVSMLSKPGDGPKAEHFVIWMQGYLSGMNYQFMFDGSGLSVDVADRNAQWTSLWNDCLDNPDDYVGIGVLSVWYELRRNQNMRWDEIEYRTVLLLNARQEESDSIIAPHDKIPQIQN